MSRFYGIGVGPGDPELLTLKAINTLKILDELYVPTGVEGGDSEALNIVMKYLPEQLVIHKRHFPMTKNVMEKEQAWVCIADEIKLSVNAGKNVGFITLGDPMLYSTYGYILKRLRHQVDVSTIPGLSAFASIASGYNQILVDGDTPLLIFPCVGDLEDIEGSIVSHESIVLMKVYKSFNLIRDIIVKHKLESVSLVVSDYGKANEICHGDIQMINSEDIGYFTTIIINKRWFR